MKITVLTISKTNQNFVLEGIHQYAKRLKKYLKFDLVEIPDLKNQKKLSKTEIKNQEGKLLLSKIPKGSYAVVLDEKGKLFSSIDFAKWIETKQVSGVSHLCFIIGGAYGFSEELYQKVDFRLSLSQMTFSHQIIRVIFMEQLYRAFSILHNDPYHNE